MGIDTRSVVWKRCLDMNDRVLRNVVVGLGNKMDGTVREDHFVITVASEIMAVLCLADDMDDLKARLSRMVVAYNFAGEPVTAKELGAVCSMAALLKDALKPNLIQTLEHTPALVHGGPFANIAHGCNSVRATKTALKIADYVITDTFHGTIFSIINRKKFVTLIRESKGSSYGNQEKLQDLLDRLGLQARSFSNGKDNLYKSLSADIDYEKVFDVIDTERKHTMEYLSTNLEL